MKDPRTWPKRRLQIAARYKATRNQRVEFLHVYSDVDLDRIAKAIHKNPSEVRSHKLSFENCAFWYRIGHGFWMKRPKQIPPSKMHARITQICKATDRLLRTLEARSDAEEGIGEGALGQQIFEAFSWAGPSVAEAVALEIRHLNKAREAAKSLRTRALAAAADIRANEMNARSKSPDAKLKDQRGQPSGNQKDAVLNGWVACSMSLYEKITGEPPKTSVRGPVNKRAGEADGPLLRFLVEAGTPLGISQSKNALRARVRRLLKQRPAQGKGSKPVKRRRR